LLSGGSNSKFSGGPAVNMRSAAMTTFSPDSQDAAMHTVIGYALLIALCIPYRQNSRNLYLNGKYNTYTYESKGKFLKIL
jgi:hypothetical protein